MFIRRIIEIISVMQFKNIKDVLWEAVIFYGIVTGIETIVLQFFGWHLNNSQRNTKRNCCQQGAMD